ncbi:helix-turn-helix domain-containing protein [Nocardia transvalensis]|uniref:helix-turn-helix domain-containing protein n=1 Tax=Nocardia transvalensis TaxID=37333 RepID=UPI001894142A|nr:helix-turn-helix domain-containing protein [Nocardia transvalensis]MBF6332132.1 helix-turn-helix domain-containing protein [Nocardia transvalensis]
MSRQGDAQTARTAKARIPVEDKVRIVLSVLKGEMSVSEAARRRGVSAMAVTKWKQAFLDAGAKALEPRPSGPHQTLGDRTPKTVYLQGRSS